MLQNGVAARMPIRIVDGFEIVDIEDAETQWSFEASGPLNFQRHALFERTPVAKSGQDIVVFLKIEAGNDLPNAFQGGKLVGAQRQN